MPEWGIASGARVEAAHQVGAAAEGAEAHAAAQVFAEGREVGEDAELALQAAGGEARGHDLVEDQEDAVAARGVA